MTDSIHLVYVTVPLGGNGNHLFTFSSTDRVVNVMNCIDYFVTQSNLLYLYMHAVFHLYVYFNYGYCVPVLLLYHVTVYYRILCWPFW